MSKLHSAVLRRLAKRLNGEGWLSGTGKGFRVLRDGQCLGQARHARFAKGKLLVTLWVPGAKVGEWTDATNCDFESSDGVQITNPLSLVAY